MALLAQIKGDLTSALKSGEKDKATTFRMLLSEIRNKEIELVTTENPEVTDEVVVSVIRKEIKKRRESIEAYQKGNRQDLVDKEQQELDLLSSYLPVSMTDEDLEKIVKVAIAQTGASSQADFGRVMGAVMAKVKGQADGGQISAIVKKILY